MLCFKECKKKGFWRLTLTTFFLSFFFFHFACLPQVHTHFLGYLMNESLCCSGWNSVVQVKLLYVGGCAVVFPRYVWNARVCYNMVCLETFSPVSLFNFYEVAFSVLVRCAGLGLSHHLCTELKRGRFYNM